MFKLKNSELEALLIQLSGMDNKGKVVGLLHENVTLGFKRKAQKIRAAIWKQFSDFQDDHKEINDKFPIVITEKDNKLTKEQEKQNEINKKEREKEFKILLDEEVEIQCDKISLEMLEEIKTSVNYDFELLEKIAE